MAGEQNIMAEIFARGPIACTIAVTADFEKYSGGIFDDKTGAKVVKNIYLSIYIYIHILIPEI